MGATPTSTWTRTRRGGFLPECLCNSTHWCCQERVFGSGRHQQFICICFVSLCKKSILGFQTAKPNCRMSEQFRIRSAAERVLGSGKSLHCTRISDLDALVKQPKIEFPEQFCMWGIKKRGPWKTTTLHSH